MATVLVTGGTGTLGRAVTARLAATGHEVRSLSRRAPVSAPEAGSRSVSSGSHPGARPRSYAVDLRDGVGLDEAVRGADAIVHCATMTAGGDVQAAGQLIEAARRARVPHLLYISIVGIDRVPLRYYRDKLQVERLLAESGAGWTVLRTTQFHDLVLRLVKAGARAPVIPVPAGIRVQPIDVRDVAGRLARLATAPPAGRVADMGGPEVRDLGELVRLTLLVGGRRRLLVPLWFPGAVAAAFRSGHHLAPEHATGTVTYEEFLAKRSGGRAEDGLVMGVRPRRGSRRWG
ncbi:NAD(P)H-binding protein [Streptomyces sp. MST-110588]|uniref:SDR family oxidoreductase n=1 Tax=Streptomyces sp. MST-110588 TaxID=2833628 RepID=UPI001F5C7C20|nr:NAD(P)H-binding protein [Streptomyces sp. MST-110588]UNO38952.1 NAD(P)H-binding protein [Streptomyces sp. MST-110588]